jgi:transcriptional regulator with XRE-family HTH domain
MTDSPQSVDEPFEPVGVILARWRKSRGLTGQALGERAGMSQAKISRLENGVVAAEPADVRRLAEKLGVPPAEAERVVAQAERAENRLAEWITGRPTAADRQHQTAQIEEHAREIRVFQPTVVPGLAQTGEYARAVVSSPFKEVPDPPVAVAEAVDARMRRGRVLLLPEHQFHLLITEQVLRNRVCGPAAMVGQIARLREVAAYPNVHVRIIADDAVLPIATYHGFYVADDRWVSVDLFNTVVMSKGRKTVLEYRRVFDALENVARADIDELLDRYQVHYARMLLQKS